MNGWKKILLLLGTMVAQVALAEPVLQLPVSFFTVSSKLIHKELLSIPLLPNTVWDAKVIHRGFEFNLSVTKDEVLELYQVDTVFSAESETSRSKFARDQFLLKPASDPTLTSSVVYQIIERSISAFGPRGVLLPSALESLQKAHDAVNAQAKRPTYKLSPIMNEAFYHNFDEALKMAVKMGLLKNDTIIGAGVPEMGAMIQK